MSSLFMLISAFLLFNLVQSLEFSSGPMHKDCVACICQAESNCMDEPCEEGKGCGYFKLTREHWVQCMEPKGNFEACAHDVGCSSSCLQVYVALYSYYCGGHTCEHAARLINGGRAGCKAASTLPYWQKVEKCLKQK